MKIILDFDDVIFNTRKFSRDYRKVFFNHGISGKIFSETYRGQVPSKKRIYDFQKHIEAISVRHPIDMSGFKKEIGAFLKTAAVYVFPDAFAFFDKFGKKNLFLVSFGTKEFQGAKIDNAKISRYFAKTVVSDKPKSFGVAMALKNSGIQKKEKIFFFDDRAELIEEVKKKYPGIFTVLMRRKEGRYNDKKSKYCDFKAKNLKEAARLIENLAH